MKLEPPRAREDAGEEKSEHGEVDFSKSKVRFVYPN